MTAFVCGDPAFAHAFGKLACKVVRLDVAVLQCLEEFALHRFGQDHFLQITVDAAGRIVGGRGEEYADAEAIAGLVGRHQQARDLVAKPIAGRLRAATPREYQQPQQPAHRTDREVAQRPGERDLDLVHGVVERPRQQRPVGNRETLVLIALEQRAGDVELAEHVAQASGQRLLEFELAAQQQHRGVGQQRQRRRIAVEFAVVPAGVGVAWCRAQGGAGQAVPPAAHRIGQGEADVAEQVLVELAQPFAGVGQRRRLHFLEHPRMAQDRALAEDQQ